MKVAAIRIGMLFLIFVWLCPMAPPARAAVPQQFGTFNLPKVDGPTGKDAQGCQNTATMTETDEAIYCFIKGLIRPETGLVTSLEDEHFTTVYKNALAAMAFMHQGDLSDAKRIFDFFASRVSEPFGGFYQSWDPYSGQPDTNSERWAGDNAFLLLALNQYAGLVGSSEYQDLTRHLREWLSAQADSCAAIHAEGAANSFAALAPAGSNRENWEVLTKLFRCFSADVNYAGVADHTVRGSLVFGDIRGFKQLDSFSVAEPWCVDPSKVVQAFADNNAPDRHINVEISAQLLLAGELWQQSLGSMQPSKLQSELEKLWLPSKSNATCRGLPYRVVDTQFTNACSQPIIDPTIYKLFTNWRFNPFAPQTSAQAVCSGFIPLITDNQHENFPRLFHPQSQPPSSFPQEINDGVHKQIIIEFTSTVSLQQVPITLTLDTVDKSQDFSVQVQLADGDHCLGVCDRTTIITPTGQNNSVGLTEACQPLSLPLSLFLPLVVRDSNTNTPYVYQLVLEGMHGWGVFDALKLETANTVIWHIGVDDGSCKEFDHQNFNPCQ
ncbi:MAG: hypothetical protein U0350_36605 [Caldilineaceae bacterium]